MVAREGWDRLSVRSVAAVLGVTPMALYRHIPDAAALSAAVVDQIAGGVPAVDTTDDLADDLARWARAARDHLRQFPGTSAHLLTSWFASRAMLAKVEGLLRRVELAGFADAEMVAAVNAVMMYVLMRVEAERTVAAGGAVKRTLNLRGKDPELPLMSRLRRHYSTAQFDVHFEYGLAALLRGITDNGAGG